MSLIHPTRRERVLERLAAAALHGIIASLSNDDDIYYESLSDEDAEIFASAAVRVADATLRKLYP